MIMIQKIEKWYIMCFIFLISKRTNIYIWREKRVSSGWSKAYRVYTRGAKKHEQKEEGIQKITSPHLEPDQSKKLIKGRGPSSIIDLVQDQKLHTKEFFILWIESSSFSKAILFLSFQTAQKRHERGCHSRLTTLLAHVDTMPTKKGISNRIRKGPHHSKKSKQ